MKRVDKSRTRRFERGEDLGKYPNGMPRPERDRNGDWIEVRTSLSKEEDAKINDTGGLRRITTDAGIELRGNAQTSDRMLFELLAVGWSLEPGTPNVDDYLQLDAADAEWVDECVGIAIDEARGEVEGKDSSAERTDPPNDGPVSSAAGDDPAPTG